MNHIRFSDIKLLIPLTAGLFPLSGPGSAAVAYGSIIVYTHILLLGRKFRIERCTLLGIFYNLLLLLLRGWNTTLRTLLHLFRGFNLFDVIETAPLPDNHGDDKNENDNTETV